jgi:hypothetical protein
MTYTSDKWLWLDADGNVTEQQPSSGSLLVPAGGEIPDEVAARYGLTTPAAGATAEPKAQQSAPENKAKQAAPENKSQ